MSTLSKHTGNGNPRATSQQPKDTKEQIAGVLQQFDVLPSRFDRVIFKYIYVYLIGLFVPVQLLTIISLLGMNTQVGEILLRGVGLGVLPMLAIILGIWRFNARRVRTPKTLRDLWEHKRIAVPDGDADPFYLRFLAHYRDALASPKRYFPSGFLMIVISILYAYSTVQTLSSEGPNTLVTILVVGYMFSLFSYLGGVLLCRNTDLGNVRLGRVRQETGASIPAQHSALSPRPVRWPQVARQFLFWLSFTTPDPFWTPHRIQSVRSFGVLSRNKRK
jgi:hypothetical protein